MVSTYDERQELQTQYLIARGWTKREGWCAGAEVDEWVDANGNVMWASMMDNVYEGRNLIGLMSRHEISIERLDKDSYRATTLSGAIGYGVDHVTAVMRSVITHYRKENGIDDSTSVLGSATE